DKFDFAWAYDQLLWVLGTGSLPEPSATVVEYLRERVKSDPEQAVRALDGVWENLGDTWSFYGWRKECREILAAALASANATARTAPLVLVNTLASRGHPVFRSLLTPAP